MFSGSTVKAQSIQMSSFIEAYTQSGCFSVFEHDDLMNFMKAMWQLSLLLIEDRFY